MCKRKLGVFVRKIDGLQPKVLPKSNLGRAIAYAESMKPYFPNYFLDGRNEISDAYSERGVKPFVILRKNMRKRKLGVFGPPFSMVSSSSQGGRRG